MSGVEGPGVEGFDPEELETIEEQISDLQDAVTALQAASLLKYSNRLLTDANGDLTVTFPNGMFTTPPVVNPQVESPSASEQYQVQLVGTPTTTTAVIRVRRFNLIGLLTGLFTNPGATAVHVQASVDNIT